MYQVVSSVDFSIMIKINNEELEIIIMKLENIEFRGEKYNFTFSRYESSDFIAILMGEPDDEFPAIITTNHGDVTKADVNGDEFIQIRSDELEYAELLIKNGLIKNESTFVLESGWIYIVFFAPTDEFMKYIEENVK